MNYQHSYHAGCIADVFKHIVLLQLLKTFHQKPSAFSYIETHAGDALYDLYAETSQKTLEYQTGIDVLLHRSDIANNAIEEYIDIIKNNNATESFPQEKNQSLLYPGSSLFARSSLREQDEEILCELHPEVYKNLYQYYRRDKQIHVHHRNGYEAFSAFLPPKSKRGLVLIDPPFEIPDEYTQIINALNVAQTRWPTGMYAIWFPIKQYEIILDFYQKLKQLSFTNILSAEFWAKQDSSDNRVKGSGMIIINPPWQFDILLENLLPVLAQELNIEKEGKAKVIWVKK